jgi:prepilin-type N-terminal cleavage/methylation domain-containing protein
MRKLRVFLQRGDEGLTLIELMLVVLVIGVLAGVIAVNLNGVVANAKINSMKGTLSALQTAVDTFSANKDGKFPTATGNAGAISAAAADNNGKTFVEAYVHNLPSTVCTDWGVTCTGVSPSWSVSANGKAYFTDGAGTPNYWYLPTNVTASGTTTAP